MQYAFFVCVGLICFIFWLRILQMFLRLYIILYPKYFSFTLIYCRRFLFISFGYKFIQLPQPLQCQTITLQKFRKPTHADFTCTNSITETLEHYVKSVQKKNNKDTITKSVTSFWCLYCNLCLDFTHYFSVSIVYSEQKNTGWVT